MREKKLGYLSGAPRVSTRPEAEAWGPKSHILGFIGAFRQLGWDVRPFIVGDRMPTAWVSAGSEQKLSRGLWTRAAADLVRLALAYRHRHMAWKEIGPVDWVYERFGVFQSLGRAFQRRGIPWILETNGPFFYEAKTERRSIVLSAVARHLEIKAYRDCDVLVCITKPLRDIIVREAGVPPDKIVLVPNGVDTVRFDPAKADGSRYFSIPTLGFVGSLIAWQGLDRLITAVAELKQEGIHWALVIAGNGPERRAWEALARDRGVSDRVLFLGGVPWDQVPQVLGRIDVGYSGQVPMKIGTMYHSPLKLYEYLAMGKPVVAAAYEDAVRVVVPEETGYLFAPDSMAELKRALRRAHRHRERWQDMGAKARQQAFTRHGWVVRVRHLIAEVERILSRKGSCGSRWKSFAFWASQSMR
ncbi:MAG: glycosyltransferase [Desulfosoma sp.]|uniref:glycosyltransferase n=1 Tax=Desulfosoma sp. TaxID=2603217 RepID=UPI00404B6494